MCLNWFIYSWHGCTRIYKIIIMWFAFFLKLINKKNMTWINKSIETHSFFHILSLPYKEQFLLGFKEDSLTLNLLILIAKNYIYKCKLKEKIPNIMEIQTLNFLYLLVCLKSHLLDENFLYWYYQCYLLNTLISVGMFEINV
jgi:hypothetical protein